MTARARLAALLALLPVSLAVLVGCGDDDEPSAQDPNDNPSQSGKPTKEQSPTEEPTQSASDSGSPATVAVPIYFVGVTPQGPRQGELPRLACLHVGLARSQPECDASPGRLRQRNVPGCESVSLSV